MPSGGSRNKSGPPPDPMSARSDARGLVFTALPASGYAGPVPDFPLPDLKLFRYELDDDSGRRFPVFDKAATATFLARERDLWAWAWTLPQAHAWSAPSEGWRLHTVAMWVRTAVVCEGSEATAADKNSLHRFADGIGLTTAGLRANGWQIAPAAPVSEPASPPKGSGSAVKSRLTVVKSAG